MESRPRFSVSFRIALFLAPLLLAAVGFAARADSDAITPRRTTASLSGIVVTNGAPVAGAVVTESVGGESVQTDSRGRFVLSGLPQGPTTLTVVTGTAIYNVRFQSSRGGKSRGIISIGGMTSAGGSAAVLLPIMAGGHEGAEIEGPVTANDGTNLTVTDATLGPVTVTTDANTVIRHGGTILALTDITVGMTVHAKAALQADGVTYLAGEIIVQDENTGGGSGANETELSGTVTSFDCTAGTMVLTTDSGDVNVTFDSNTVFKSKGQIVTCDALAVGDDAEVDGTLQTDGSVLASKVSFEAPETEVSGIVKSFDCTAGTMVLTTDSGDVNITFDSNTVFKMKGQIVTCDALAVGDDAEVDGTLQGDGSILASKVTFDAPETEQVEVEGTVSSVAAPNFVVTTDSGDVTVDTDGSTQFFLNGNNPASFSDIAVGVKVSGDGTLQTDGSVLASKVHINTKGGD